MHVKLASVLPGADPLFDGWLSARFPDRGEYNELGSVRRGQAGTPAVPVPAGLMQRDWFCSTPNDQLKNVK
jgi:hypothetical protein